MDGPKAEKLCHDERILQATDKCISSRDNHYEKTKGILREVLEDVFTTVKARNQVLQELLQDVFFVEKHYKGPTVIKPEEFHVYIIFQFPLHYENIKFEDGQPGYKHLKSREISCFIPLLSQSGIVTVTTSYEYHKEDLRQLLFDYMLTWIMSNVPRMNNYKLKMLEDSTVFIVRFSKQVFPEMDVSLTTVFGFDCKPPYTLAKEGFKWYATPEPQVDVRDEDFRWQPFLFNHENDFLMGHSYLMPVIRQLEKLRDTQEWKVILQYHIKALVMQYARSTENGSGLPDTRKLTGTELFIHVLYRLSNMCKTQYHENFWDSKHNLINANHSQLAVIGEKLTRMINEITDDSAKVADWILTSEELTMYRNELKALEILQDTDGPSQNLRMSMHDKPGSPKGIRNTADGVSKPVTGATAASGCIESSPSNGAGKDIAGWLEELDRVIAGLNNSMDLLSRRLAALEQKSAETA